jgi:signal transduction histidine kinase
MSFRKSVARPNSHPASEPLIFVREAAHVPDAGRAGALAAAGVAHDLGNLIQVALSAIALAARSGGGPGDQTAAMLGRAQASLDQAGRLVRQTIGAMRDRADLIEEVDIGRCLQEVAALAEGLRGASMAIRLEIANSVPRVRCDPQALRNAILNLVFNARDAMAGGGVVVIAARGRVEGDAPIAEVSVLDTGVGMSAETLARAFDPFFTTKSDGLGGVGLPMVERFVADARGRITVHSELGTGTEIGLLLPAVDSGSNRRGDL